MYRMIYLIKPSSPEASGLSHRAYRYDFALQACGDCVCGHCYLRFKTTNVLIGRQKEAQNHSGEGYGCEIDDEAGAVQSSGGVVHVADPEWAGGAPDGVCRPGKSIENREVPAPEIACQQVGHRVGFTAQADA